MGEIARIEDHQTSREVATPQSNLRLATDVAGVCREIVLQTSMEIQGQKYVRVEGWQAIATAHGCALSATEVQKVDGGFSAIGQVRRDGKVVAEAEGFVGDDERLWASKPVYARRAMAQTRAMSRAARSAFAHVVVMMNAGLSTTPLEEMQELDVTPAPTQKPQSAAPSPRQNAEAKEGDRRLVNLGETIPKWFWDVPKAERSSFLPPSCSYAKNEDGVWVVVMRQGGPR